VKNPDVTVADLIKEKIAKVGENITVSRFIRFVLGEAS
jgi:elongation factor Ts